MKNFYDKYFFGNFHGTSAYHREYFSTAPTKQVKLGGQTEKPLKHSQKAL